MARMDVVPWASRCAIQPDTGRSGRYRGFGGDTMTARLRPRGGGAKRDTHPPAGDDKFAGGFFGYGVRRDWTFPAWA
jgi:hypothetical protein